MRLDPERAVKDGRGRSRLHADLAHPINSATRIEAHKAVVRAYAEEVEAQAAAGESYRPKSFEDLDQLSEFVDDEYLDELERRQDERSRRQKIGRVASETGVGELGAGEPPAKELGADEAAIGD